MLKNLSAIHCTLPAFGYTAINKALGTLIKIDETSVSMPLPRAPAITAQSWLDWVLTNGELKGKVILSISCLTVIDIVRVTLGIRK